MIEYKKEIKLAKSLICGGYLWFFDSEHPMRHSSGHVLYHRHVAAMREGRWLSSKELVHHIDENKLNNAPENLQIVDCATHNKLHGKLKNVEIVCKNCGEKFKPSKSIKLYCRDCSKINKITRRLKYVPSYEELFALANKMPMTEIGKLYGVSDNGIRKWFKKYGIDTKRGRGFWHVD